MHQIKVIFTFSLYVQYIFFYGYVLHYSKKKMLIIIVISK